MKKIAILLLIVLGVLLAGCQSSSSTSVKDAGTIKAAAESIQSKTGSAVSTKPATAEQKAEISKKMDPAMKSVDESLKSIYDVKDIDLSSVK